MKLLLAIQTVIARRAAVLCCILLTVMSGAALAQTTGSVNPSPGAAEPSVKVDVSPGDCMPIGLTASGEFVFPILCKELIERERGKVVEQKPAAVEEKPPDTEEKPAAEKSEAVAPEISKPADNPVKTSPLQKRVEREPGERTIGPPGCTRFRSYDPESGTYRSYDGRRLSCR
jgi:hypothetical protein